MPGYILRTLPSAHQDSSDVDSTYSESPEISESLEVQAAPRAPDAPIAPEAPDAPAASAAMVVSGYQLDAGGWLVPESELPDNYANIPNDGRFFGTDRVNANTGMVETHHRVLDWEYDQLTMMKKGPQPEYVCWRITYPEYPGIQPAGAGYTFDSGLATIARNFCAPFGFEVSEPLPHYPGYDAEDPESFDWELMWRVDVWSGASGMWGKDWFISRKEEAPYDWTTIGRKSLRPNLILEVLTYIFAVFFAYCRWTDYYIDRMRPMVDDDDDLYYLYQAIQRIWENPNISNRPNRRNNGTGPEEITVATDLPTEAPDISSSTVISTIDAVLERFG